MPDIGALFTVTGIVTAVHVVLAFLVVAGILMHDAKDSGLSSMVNLSGSPQVLQRNLTRGTLIAALMLVGTTIWLGFRTL